MMLLGAKEMEGAGSSEATLMGEVSKDCAYLTIWLGHRGPRRRHAS